MQSIPKGPQGFVEIQGESIYFESYGRGETVILCHGKGGNHAIWYQQVPILARRYQVVTWDQRGFGRSTDHQLLSSPTTAVDDLKVLMDHLGIERAHLVGQSMGGWAVLGFALEWPERTSSLILADTLAGIYTPEIQRIDAEIKAARYAQPPSSELGMNGHPIMASQTEDENLIRAFLYGQIGRSHGPPPAAMSDRLRQTRFDLDRVAALNVPTLFIVGERDAIFPPYLIKMVAAQMPHAQMLEIPEADHSPYYETPQAFNAAVQTFWESLNG